MCWSAAARDRARCGSGVNTTRCSYTAAMYEDLPGRSTSSGSRPNDDGKTQIKKQIKIEKPLICISNTVRVRYCPASELVRSWRDCKRNIFLMSCADVCTLDREQRRAPNTELSKHRRRNQGIISQYSLLVACCLAAIRDTQSRPMKT